MNAKNKWIVAVALVLCVLTLGGCYSFSPSRGGGETSFTPPRKVNPSDVALPAGYRIEAIATGLTFPTGVAFDDKNVPHVIEAGYSYGEDFTTPRLLRVGPDGKTSEIARGEKNGPWTGIVHANGAFYIAEGGQLQGGRILRITPDGKISTLVDKLPSMGDHHTNGPAIGPDGRIYFSQGVVTNSAVVGEDNLKFGWLKRFPKFHDVPCRDITLAGVNFETPDVLNGSDRRVQTGAYSPFGTPTKPGQVVKGRVPCGGAVMRVGPHGGQPELVAWGFRNPFGLAFAPDGQLYATDNAFDDRGSRPVWGAPDVLWRVVPNTWYGWPDFSEGRPVNQSDYRSPLNATPQLVLAQHPNRPPRPVAVLGVHASSNGIDFSRSKRFGHVGQAFIAEFGDQAPVTGKVMHPVGFRVIRVDVSNGRIEDFAVNKGAHNGPASHIGGAGLERPVGLRFDRTDDALYIVDFGVMLMTKKGPLPQRQTGVLWRVTREGGR